MTVVMQESSSGKSPHRALCLLLVAGAVLWFSLPGSEQRYIVCPLHWLTGWDCPLCGGQRMVHDLLCGQWRTAFFHNPLLFVALPFMGLWLFRLCFPAVCRRHPRLTGERLFSSRACFGYFLVALVWGIVRNL